MVRSLWSLMAILAVAESARILGVFPSYLKSHSFFTHPIMMELARRGHQVTMVTPFGDKNAPKGYEVIEADKKSIWDMDFTEETANFFVNTDVPFMIECFERWNSLSWFTETGFNSTKVNEFILKDKSHYDLVITEVFLQEANLMFAHKYKAPIVTLSTYGSGQSINEFIGNPLLLPAEPHEFISFFSPLTLVQRTKNALFTIFDLLGRRFYHLPDQQRLAEKYFGHLPGPLPQLSDLENNISLVLVNTHFSVDNARPTTPGFVEVGGIHVGETKPLPEDLKKICDSAKEGIIFFSLGSILKSSKMPREKINALAKVFSGLKQIVFWKWEGGTKPEASNNVKFVEWLPQAGILNHPNAKVYITHGGLLGMQEAIYHGVPIIGMPFFGDQFRNVDRAVKHGYGVMLRFKDITEDTLSSSLDLVLNDPSYMKNAKLVAKRFKDKPSSPLDTAIYWIEYVIRHDGAPHLRSRLLDLPWYQYLLIDVVAVVAAALACVGVAGYLLIFVVCRLLLFRKPHKRKAKQH